MTYPFNSCGYCTNLEEEAIEEEAKEETEKHLVIAEAKIRKC